MSDNQETILSKRGASGVPGAPPPPDAEQKRNPLVIAGGIGCALLLCAALALGGGYYMFQERMDAALSALLDEPTATPTETFVPEPTATPMPEPTETQAPENTPTSEATPTPENLEPEIGSITFALDATEGYDPIEPGTSFEGEIAEIHAIFDYSGFSPDDVWERVWFLDGNEMLRSEEPWSGAQEGVFDYFINAGGEPLSPGEWTLELYVDNQLLATDSFIIVAEGEPATATADALAALNATPTPESTATLAVTPTPEASPSPTPTPQPVSRTYRLAFTKWDGGKHNLFIGNTSGGPAQYIFSRAAGPSWTPDGQFLFFYGQEGVDRQVIDGTEYVFDGISNGIVSMDVSPIPTSIDQVQLFQGLDWKFGSARWANVSPNGQMVAFDASLSGDQRIYFLGTAGNQQYRFEILGEQADWSPDSQKVVYRSGRNGTTGIWISNRDDSGHTLITNGGSDAFPAWSPDGRTIVFHRDEGGNVDLYAVNVDGSNLRRLTSAPGPDTLPEFTPSGEVIFRSARTGSWGVWKMNMDGSNQQQLYSDSPVSPDWSYSRMGVLP